MIQIQQAMEHFAGKDLLTCRKDLAGYSMRQQPMWNSSLSDPELVPPLELARPLQQLIVLATLSEMSVVPAVALISRPETGFERTTSLLPSVPVVTATSLDDTPVGSTTSTESVPRVAMEEA